MIYGYHILPTNQVSTLGTGYASLAHISTNSLSTLRECQRSILYFISMIYAQHDKFAFRKTYLVQLVRSFSTVN